MTGGGDAAPVRRGVGQGARWCAGVSLMALAIAAAAGGEARAQAAAVAPPPSAAQVAQAAPTFALDIPAKPLLAALADFTAATGVQVVRQSASALAGESAPLRGTFTADEALGRLLAGTGYTHRMADPATAVLEPANAAAGGGGSGAVVLDPVTVQGRRTAADAAGAVDGYVATHSAAGTKAATPLVETPRSVSVVPRAQIEDQGSKTVMQAMRYTPGAFTGQVGASNRYDYVILRGIVDRSINNVFLDGLKILGDDATYSSMQVDPYFLERIEAVKGPASVLYGQNSPGGLIAMTSKKPLFEPFAEIEASVGTGNQRGAAFDVSGPIGAGDRAAFRVTGLTDAADTQFDHTEEKRYAVAPSLTMRLTEDTTLTAMAYLQHDPEGGTHNGAPAEGVLYPRNGRTISRHFFDGEPGLEAFERTQRMVGYQFEHRVDDTWTVRQNLRYLDSDVHIDQVYQTGWVAGTDTLSRYYGGGDETLQAIAVDTQVQAEFATGTATHTVLAGLDHQHRRSKNDWLFAPMPAIDAFDPVYGNDALAGGAPMRATRTLAQTGLYLQDQIAWGGWRLSLGGRQDWAERTNHDRIAGTRTGEDRSKFTKQGGVLYLFDSGIAPYASYAESFNPSLYSDADGNPLAPTEGVQLEVGVKYQPPGGRSLLTAALFQLEQENVAVADPNTFVYHPVGTIRTRGLELEGRVQVTDGLRVLAGYTLLDTEYKTSPDGKQGNTPPQIPRHMASLWAEYAFAEGPLANLSLGAGVRYVGESWADSLNTTKVPSATVVDVSLRYGLDALGLPDTQLRVNANNLFDKTYVASCLELANCYYGAERSVTATLTHRF